MYITPGDPARIILGDTATDEEVQQLQEDLGLNRPYIVRYLDFLKKAILQGDLGTSYLTKRSVTSEIIERYPTTIILAVASVLLATMIGIPLGIVSAVKQYSFLDYASSTVALVGVSMPNFWQGMINILIFAVALKWFPASGFYGPSYWVLPAVTIGTSAAASIMRTTRSSMLEVIRQDYIRTARAKGQTERIIIYRHALKNALIPIVTIIGIRLGANLGGAILTESIFSIPGLGKLMVDSIKARNYPVVQGGVLFIAVIFSLINLLVDILYAYIDPRIKSQYQSKKKKKNIKSNTEIQKLKVGGIS
jgi:peptide/nickel transport system permease protein